MTPASNGIAGWFGREIVSAELTDAGAKRISLCRVLSRRVLATFTKTAHAMHDDSSFAWMRRMPRLGEPRTMLGAATERAPLAEHWGGVASSRNS